MKHLLTPHHLKELEFFIQPSSILAFDFDGTLAPIVTRPSQARPSQKSLSLLQKLNDLSSIAIITGRSISDIEPRLGFSPRWIIGNHGIENPWTSPRSLSALQTICKKWKLRLQSHLENHVSKGFIEIEDKTYTLSVHFRKAPHPHQTENLLNELFETLEPEPRVIPGKFVFNLMPARCLNKGTALLKLIQRAKAQNAFYIGDDDTDEDVFRLQNPKIFTVRVGRKRNSLAHYSIREQKETRNVLQHLVQITRRLRRENDRDQNVSDYLS